MFKFIIYLLISKNVEVLNNELYKLKNMNKSKKRPLPTVNERSSRRKIIKKQLSSSTKVACNKTVNTSKIIQNVCIYKFK